MELEGTSYALQRYTKQLAEFRDLQLDRARRLGKLADEMMEFVRLSLLRHHEQGLILHAAVFCCTPSSGKEIDGHDTEAAALVLRASRRLTWLIGSLIGVRGSCTHTILIDLLRVGYTYTLPA